VHLNAFGPPTLTKPTIPAANQFRFTMNGWPGGAYNIVTSTDLKNWVTNSSVTNISGADTVTLSTSGSKTYYGLQRK